MAVDEQDDQQFITRGEFHRWRKRAVVGYIILAVAAIISTWMIVDVFQRFETESLNRDTAIRTSQIAACQVLTGAESANRVAILRAIRNQNTFLRRENEDNKNIPPEFFPNIPPAEFEELIREGIRANKGAIKTNKETIAALIGQEACRSRYDDPLPAAG
jgi:hypothetical protein